MIKFWQKLLILAPFAFLLTGCGDNGITELQQWMDTVKKESSVVIAKVSEPKVYVPVPYSGKNQIDPYNPAKLLVVLARMKAESNNGLRPDMERRKEVLEAFPLDSLKMVGVIEKSNIRNALILLSFSLKRLIILPDCKDQFDFSQNRGLERKLSAHLPLLLPHWILF